MKSSFTCDCGLVVFDLSRREAGEVLACSWCDRAYRHQGGGRVERIEDGAPYGVDLLPEFIDLRAASGVKGAGDKPAAVEQAPPRKKAPRPTPGGVLPMILCIVIFNSLAFVALAFLFPQTPEGSRHFFWNTAVVLKKDPWWLYMLALLVGHGIGFVAWVCYIYHLHRQGRLYPKIKKRPVSVRAVNDK